MTRNEFIDNCTEWSELLDFCRDYDCSYCDNVYDEYDRDDYINSNLCDMASSAENWEDLLDTLRDIPTGYYYYILSNDAWYTADDNDFDAYKNDVLEWGDDAEIWEYDEDDEDDEEEGKPWYISDEEFTPPDEPISIGDLMMASSSQLQHIGECAEKEASLDEQAFRELVGEVSITTSTRIYAPVIDD